MPQDFKESLALFRAAAQLGNDDAVLAVGRAFAEGRGALKDYGAAVNIFRELAQRSQVEAFNELALSYENGNGVAKSPVIAYAIYNFAATRFPHAVSKFSARREKNP